MKKYIYSGGCIISIGGSEEWKKGSHLPTQEVGNNARV